MSYVREDDKYGRLTELRERLESEIRMQIGEPFPIFQDRNDILWGQNWKVRIEEALDEVTFLLPIITPSFFRSPACREELQRFLEREFALESRELILPVYYVDTPLLNDPPDNPSDPLVAAIASRQLGDWRPWRHEPFSSPDVGKLLAGLGSQVRDALERLGRERPVPPEPANAHTRNEEPLSTRIELGEARSLQQAGAGAVKHNEPPTHVVDQLHRGDFTTITEAIQAANPGDRILVRPGYYREGLVLDKPLEIVGEGGLSEIVIRAINEPALLFQTTMGRASNLTLRQAGNDRHFGVHITQGRLELEDCDVSCENHTSIVIGNHADPRLRRNRIHGSREFGVLVLNEGRGTYEDNEITGNQLAGVTIGGGGEPTLRRNRIHDNQEYGVYVLGSGGTLEDNDIFENGDANLAIKKPGEVVVRRNRIHNGRGCGVVAFDQGTGTLEDNEIFGNLLAGVVIRDGSRVTLRRNRIHKNGDRAIDVHEGGGGIFENNDLRDNTGGSWKIAKKSEGEVKRSGNME